MQLTEYEKEMAAGKYGPGLQKAINILIRYGEACGAEKFVEISSAHIMPKEPPELLEMFTEGVDCVPVITTTHPLMSAFSPEKWEDMGIPHEYAEKELPDHEKRQRIHQRLGIVKSYSCLPMHMGNLPRKGAYTSWIGSCAQILCNSLIGARTNKDGTIINLCCALTGRALYHGLLMQENRYAKVVIRLADDVVLEDDADYGALGYYVGNTVKNSNVVFDGISPSISFDHLKYMVAPVATSGSVHICHVVGITPEAATLEEALGGREPEETLVVTREDLKRTKKLYEYFPEKEVNLVLIGCPHVTIEEARTLAGFLKGKRVPTGKHLWIAMGDPTYTLAKAMGYTDIIEGAGGVISHTCMATIPDSPIPEDTKAIMTNSFKSAHYVTSLQQGRVPVMVGGLKQCFDALRLREHEVSICV